MFFDTSSSMDLCLTFSSWQARVSENNVKSCISFLISIIDRQEVQMSPEGGQILHITHRWLHSTCPGNVHIKALSWTHTHLQSKPWGKTMTTLVIRHKIKSLFKVMEMLLPPQERHCQERSCHHHNGAEKYITHWGHCRKPAGFRFHDGYPMKSIE